MASTAFLISYFPTLLTFDFSLPAKVLFPIGVEKRGLKKMVLKLCPFWLIKFLFAHMNNNSAVLYLYVSWQSFIYPFDFSLFMNLWRLHKTSSVPLMLR